MDEQMPMDIDPKIKKEINEEGFEENAAVLIGKEEEMPRLREKLESEGKAADLGTYIKMHKEIKLPKEEIAPALLDNVIKNKGLLWFVAEKGGGEEYFYLPESIVYNFIDKDGNIASFNLDPKMLAPTREIIEKGRKGNYHKRENNIKDEFYNFINEQTKELGFEKYSPYRHGEDRTDLIREINDQILDYKKTLEMKLEQAKKEKFDF